jgi:hypothetical protein
MAECSICLNDKLTKCCSAGFFFSCVEPEFSTVGGMLGAASIVTGMIAGIGFSYLMPILISTPGHTITFYFLRYKLIPANFYFVVTATKNEAAAWLVEFLIQGIDRFL